MLLYSGFLKGLSLNTLASLRGLPSITKTRRPLSSLLLPFTVHVPFHETWRLTVEPSISAQCGVKERSGLSKYFLASLISLYPSLVVFFSRVERSFFI